MPVPFHEQFVALAREVADLKRRADNGVRHGKVTDVDEEKHRIRMQIGGTDDEPQKSPWIPYAQIAGKLKLHSMPSVGQQMTMFAPTGDFRQAMALPLTWSDDNESPSKKKDEHVLTFENVTIKMKKDLLSFKVGDTEVELTKDALNHVAQSIHTVGSTYLGVDSKGEKPNDKVEVVSDEPSKKVYAKK